MKFLLTAVGTRGDVQPILSLARALTDAGQTVTFCAPDRFAEWVRAEGFEFRAVGVDPQALLAAEKNLSKMKALFREDAERQFATLWEASEGAALVVGASIVLAAQSVAERRGVPYVSAIFCPQTLPSASHPFLPLGPKELPRWLNRLTWWAGESVYGWLTLPLLNEHRAKWDLPPQRGPAEHMFGNEVLLAGDPLFGSAPEDAGRDVLQTGAWRWEGARLPDEAEAFLAKGPPPLYLGFGSNRDDSPEKTRALLIATAKLAGRRAVISAVPGEPDDDVLSVGDVSFERLFPRCAAVVHHGGAGTTHAAAHAGVPQLVVPHRGDQRYFAKAVRTSGLGESIPRKNLTAERLAGKVQRLLNAPQAERCRSAAAAMSKDGATRAAAHLIRRAATR